MVKVWLGCAIARLTGAARPDLAVPLLLALTPNVVMGFYFLNQARVMDAERDDRAWQNGITAEFLQAASDVTMELYPPGARSGRKVNRDAVFADLKKFEALYWGKLNLVPLAGVERCLTELHLLLTHAADGADSSSDPAKALERIEYKLTAISQTLGSKASADNHIDSPLRGASASRGCPG